MISRSARRLTRRQSQNLLDPIPLVFFTIFVIILICPIAAIANGDEKSEYGLTVIGIGRSMSTPPSLTATD